MAKKIRKNRLHTSDSPGRDSLRLAVALAVMGSCCGLLPGMAEAADPITLSSMATDDEHIKVDITGTKLTVEGGTYTWSNGVIGGTRIDDATQTTTVINDVTISKATITLSGSSYLAVGSGSDTKLTIDGSTIQGNGRCLAGTYTTTSGDVKNAEVIIQGDSTVKDSLQIYGGYAENGSVSDSKVTIQADEMGVLLP